MATVEPPWEMNQCISLSIKIIPCILQNGWKEIEHSKISKLKDRISDVANADEWEIRKKITNPYEAIFSGDDTSFPSLAKVQPLSRSYFKMIEMLGLIGFFSEVSGYKPSPTSGEVEPFVSAHICEGPGGFIQHVVEALAERNITTKGIYAMTLKPTKSHIPGWRRSIHFLKKFPKIKLEYGVDDTGNILKPANQHDFCVKAKGAHLFTADGGFDFSVNYTNQELMAFPLVLASFIMGLKTLRKGGTMIIKLFDIYSRATQDLFLGSATFFEKFTLYKPATSRPCNSERYFIGHRYRDSCESEGISEWISTLESALKRHEQSPITQLVQNEWPLAILRAVKEQILYQEHIQIKNIEDTLNLDKNTIPQRMLQNIRTSKHWCKTFGVKH